MITEQQLKDVLMVYGKQNLRTTNLLKSLLTAMTFG